MQTISTHNTHLRVWFFCVYRKSKTWCAKIMYEKLANVAVALKGKLSCEARIKEGEQNREKTAKHITIKELNFEWAREHEICVLFMCECGWCYFCWRAVVCYVRYCRYRKIEYITILVMRFAFKITFSRAIYFSGSFQADRFSRSFNVLEYATVTTSFSKERNAQRFG